AWLRLECRGELLEPEPHEREEHAAAIAGLRRKYEQYASQRLEERPVLRLTVNRALGWGDLGSSDASASLIPGSAPGSVNQLDPPIPRGHRSLPFGDPSAHIHAHAHGLTRSAALEARNN